MELFHLPQRIAGGRDVEDAVLVGRFLLWTRIPGSGVGERPRPSLFSRPLPAVPEIRERGVARLQRLEAEAIDRRVDAAAVPALEYRIDPAARLPWRPRETAGEEHVVLGL